MGGPGRTSRTNSESNYRSRALRTEERSQRYTEPSKFADASVRLSGEKDILKAPTPAHFQRKSSFPVADSQMIIAPDPRHTEAIIFPSREKVMFADQEPPSLIRKSSFPVAASHTP